MRYDVRFSDGHVETVEVEETDGKFVSIFTIAELKAVSQHPGYSRVVGVSPHVEMTELPAVKREVIDYIQRVYDQLDAEYDSEYARGVEFVVQQLGLPIRLRH